MSIDKDWEAWGQNNPFYGVISDDKFLGKKLSKQDRDDFYLSGERDIDEVFRSLERYGYAKKRYSLALDYGCGVGRLSLALANHAKRVVGYDISPSMIKEAKKAGRANKRVAFKVIDDSLKNLPESYDFLNSYIVFQHISPRRGMSILGELLSRLEEDGSLAVQLTFGYDRSLPGRVGLFLRENITPLRYVANMAKGRKYKYAKYAYAFV